MSRGNLTPTGNVSLVDYGIQTEKSDLRAHVCVLARKVYVYRTVDMLELVSQLPQRSRRTVRTGGLITATGYAVPVWDAPFIEAVALAPEWFEQYPIQKEDTTTAKGDQAVAIVKRLIEKGKLPLFIVQASVITDAFLQISGTDIQVVATNAKVQVKCDYKGGVGQGCTGNLFIQIQECNPYGYR